MPSVYQILANAQVTLQVPTTGVMLDPRTGNVVPVMEDLEIGLYLKALDIGINPFPGVETIGTVYEGYCVEPSTLDDRITVGTKGTLLFAGEAEQTCELLEVRLPYGRTGLLAGILNEIRGEKIRLVGRRQN